MAVNLRPTQSIWQKSLAMGRSGLRLDRDDFDVLRMTCQRVHVDDIDRGDDGAPREVGDCDHERVDSDIGASPHGAQQLSGANSRPCVDGMDLNALAPEAGEDGGVASSPANDLGKDRCDRSNGEAPPAHFTDECTSAIAPLSRTARDRRYCFTVEEQHQPVLRRRVRFAQSSTT